MSTDLPITWFWLAGLGALHGMNPGMGWLFAVALGLQERSERAVWRALLPLSLGHALAILAVVLPAALVGLVLSPTALKWLVAGALLTFALYRIWRRTHPHWGGMRVGLRDLTIWSALMATAHGAGLMVLPLLLPDEAPPPSVAAAAMPAPHVSPARPLPSASSPDAHVLHASAAAGPVSGHEHHAATSTEAGHASHLASAGATAGRVGGLAAALIHTLGYLLMTGVMAVVVYTWAGLRLLRRAWINVDLLWVGALIATAIVTPFL